MFRAVQRRVRLQVPAEMYRLGSALGANSWNDLSAEQVDTCLRPFAVSSNNAIARGRKPISPLLKPDVAATARSRHLAQIDTERRRFDEHVRDRMRPVLEPLMIQIFSHFRAEAENRELAFVRRRRTPPDNGPMELWQGQVAALERSLAAARLSSAEAMTLLQELATGRIKIAKPKPRSILIALASDF